MPTLDQLAGASEEQLNAWAFTLHTGCATDCVYCAAARLIASRKPSTITFEPEQLRTAAEINKQVPVNGHLISLVLLELHRLLDTCSGCDAPRLHCQSAIDHGAVKCCPDCSHQTRAAVFSNTEITDALKQLDEAGFGGSSLNAALRDALKELTAAKQKHLSDAETHDSLEEDLQITKKHRDELQSAVAYGVKPEWASAKRTCIDETLSAIPDYYALTKTALDAASTVPLAEVFKRSETFNRTLIMAARGMVDGFGLTEREASAWHCVDCPKAPPNHEVLTGMHCSTCSHGPKKHRLSPRDSLLLRNLWAKHGMHDWETVLDFIDKVEFVKQQPTGDKIHGMSPEDCLKLHALCSRWSEQLASGNDGIEEWNLVIEFIDHFVPDTKATPTTVNPKPLAGMPCIHPPGCTQCPWCGWKAPIDGDAVNHPKHYNSHPSGVECIDIVKYMTFCVGNTIKYCWRAGLKTTSPEDSDAKRLEDLKKARWYLDREIAGLEALAKEGSK